MKHYKVLFTDLDGTLISTLSGETFPKGIWDMVFHEPVLQAIKALKPEQIFIVSNQGGVEKGYVDANFLIDKLYYIDSAIEEYTGVSCEHYICTSNDKEDYNRKPNTGMLYASHMTMDTPCDKSEILMIGDASGKQGQFSDSDKRTAENYGIDYMDVADFVAEYTPETKPTSQKLTASMWLVRDDFGSLVLSETEPSKDDQAYGGFQWEDMNDLFLLRHNDFPQVTYANSPQRMILSFESLKAAEK